MTYTPDRVVIISDLHLGPGGSYDCFRSGTALAGFIKHQAQQPGRQDLVILGDALDYLQFEQPLSFTVASAVAKTKEILKKNEAVFDELAKFIQAKGQDRRRLIWAIGNHDLELLFPEVQNMIETALGIKQNDERLVWELAGGHRDYPSAAGIVRLVHGNEPDPWNRVDYKDASQAVKLARATAGDPHYLFPQGSVLVSKVLNELKKDGHVYIDLLKPETTVALPLAVALWPERTRALLRAAFPPFIKITASGLATKMKNLFIIDESVLAGDATAKSQPAVDSPDIGELLAHSLGSAALGTGQQLDHDYVAREVADWLTGAYNDDVEDLLAGRQKKAVLGDGWAKDALSWLLRGVARRMNGASEAFDLEGADENDAIIIRTLNSGVKLVVAGHTHLARAVCYPNGFYINTGTWADLIRLPKKLPKEEFTSYAKRLKEMFAAGNVPPGVCRPFQRLTYAEVELNEGRWALRQWTPEPTLTLQAFP